ncbi:MAG: YoaK family protein [Xanthobacteraceae bacterium]
MSTFQLGPNVKLLPVALCFVAGFIDVCAFIALFGTFVAQITGTYIIAGAVLVTHDPGVIIKLLAIPVFMAGAASATIVSRTLKGSNPPPLVVALFIEFALLTAFLVFIILGSATSDPNSPPHLLAAVAGFAAMGVQSALVRIFYAGVPSTNVMTTATSQIAIDVADVWLARGQRGITHVDAARRRLADTVPHVLAFLVGALAGAAAYAALQWQSVIVALAIVLAAALVAWRYPQER